MLNLCCAHAAAHTLATSNITKEYAPNRLLTKIFTTWIQSAYPEALEMLLDGQHPVYAIAHVLPFSATPAPKRFLTFEIIDGPLDLIGVALPVECRCGEKGFITAVNNRFAQLCHHLFFSAMEKDNPFPQKPDPKGAWQCFRTLKPGKAPPESLRAPPRWIWSTRLFHGISWLIFHELGHFAIPRPINFTSFSKSFLDPKRAQEECEADRAALSHLLMRLRAQDPLNKTDSQAELCLGVEGVLHVAGTICSISQGRVGRNNESRFNDGPYTPSTHLRRIMLRDAYETFQRLGFLPDNLIPRRYAFLAGLDQVFRVMTEAQ